MLEKLKLNIGLGFVDCLLLVVAGVFAAIPICLLWNWLMPAIFGIKTITFWQAWGLFFMTGIWGLLIGGILFKKD